MRAWLLAGLLVCVAAGGAAWALARWGPAPTADVAVGSEEPFLAGGAYPRELTRHGPQRWAGPQVRYVFHDLPAGPALYEVEWRAAHGPVLVVLDGAVRARLAPEARAYRERLELRAGRHELQLLSEGRSSGGRTLGVLLGRVALRPERRSAWPARLAGLLLLPAVLLLAAAPPARLPVRAAAGAALALVALGAASLWPSGLWRSPYAGRLAAALAVGALALVAFAGWCERRRPRSGGWALAALLAALAVQGVAASSPLMVVSDAVFHANKLAALAGGDWFPLSVTQHARGFRFPYGVSFYALLLPLYAMGLDAVALVRVGAALAGLVASAALFALLLEQPRRAALAVGLWQLLPVTFDAYSYGNLSNVGARAAAVGFFCWWAGRAPGGWLLGGLLWACGATAHFSEALVLGVLALALLGVRGRAWRDDRVRLRALALGLGLALAYYARFVPPALEQLPRLAEGGGRDGLGPWSALVEQARWALARWGWPAVLLALGGLPRRRQPPPARDLTAHFWAGLVLGAAAVFSPLEVRYLYALALPLSVAAADGLRRLAARGRPGWIVAGALAGWQLWIAGQAFHEALFTRYR